MKIKKLISNPLALIIISAFLSALPLTFSNLFLLSWISFVPVFFVILKRGRDKTIKVLARGFLFGFLYHLSIYYWFLWFYPMDFANLTNASSIAVVLLAWVGISLVHGLLWCIPFLVCHLLQKLNDNPLFLSFAAIIGIVLTQKATQLGELSFPWTRISLGQYTAPALIQSASLFGTDGVDMLILLINALLTFCIIFSHKNRILAAAVAVIVFCANLGFGLIRLNLDEESRKINIMTVQGSVENSDKWSSDGVKTCFNTYSSLTKESFSEDVDLIIWPESAVPKFYKNENSLKQYKSLVQELDTPLLVGVLLDNQQANTNNATLINTDGDVTHYAKRQLVPFGEYMPYQKALSKLFPFLTELNIIEDDYTAGTDSSIMEVADGKLGSIICFESIYPHLTRQSTLDGAEILVEVTNDSWLEDSPAMQQHLAHGVFRSVENGRWLIRSANSGISAIINSKGQITKLLDINQQGVIKDAAYFCDDITFYTKHGNFLFTGCIGILLVLCVGFAIKKLIINKRTAR